MTSCAEFALLISQQLDGALSETEAEQLNHHLKNCSECRALYQGLSHLQEALSSLSVAPPADLPEKIMARIKAESTHAMPAPAPITRKRPLGRWLAAAAALVLVISGTVLGSRMMSSPAGDTFIDHADADASDELSITAPSGDVPEDALLYSGGADEAAPESGADEAAIEEPQTDTKAKDDAAAAAPSAPQRQFQFPLGCITPQPEAYDADGGASANVQADTQVDDAAAPSSEEVSLAMNDEAEPAYLPESDTVLTFRSDPVPLSYEDARALLIAQLSTENQREPLLDYQGISADGGSYLFLYTDQDGTVWQYSVSSSDGSIVCESVTGDQSSTGN